MNPILVIPARMASTRLPGKPLVDIAGAPMVVQVWQRGMEADIGPVVVAAAEAEIVAAVEAAGGTAVLTDPDHPSGSDRIFEAVERADPDRRHDMVVNLQGDLPALDPDTIRASLKPHEADPGVDIATLVAEIHEAEEVTNPNVVKCVTAFAEGRDTARALWFTRLPAPGGDGPHWHHIGLYTYRREALARFVALPPSPLEKREKLEQLRALENGMRIDAARVDVIPFGVDTPEDLERMRALFAKGEVGR
ncbi:MAG: 3-deoxy-manno-octulosonate cytidylyltransferase [Minwuia sp.]|uniref:3-deoxy-manno-octulosonate cytidylyltransferase n=1 Tax=Minwuia sp. TaxID=2493630 RepID=UPI003A8C0833